MAKYFCHRSLPPGRPTSAKLARGCGGGARLERQANTAGVATADVDQHQVKKTALTNILTAGHMADAPRHVGSGTRCRLNCISVTNKMRTACFFSCLFTTRIQQSPVTIAVGLSCPPPKKRHGSASAKIGNWYIVRVRKHPYLAGSLKKLAKAHLTSKRCR